MGDTDSEDEVAERGNGGGGEADKWAIFRT